MIWFVFEFNISSTFTFKLETFYQTFLSNTPNAATREQYSLSCPISSSASLLAYQDDECMNEQTNKQKKNDRVSYKGGLQNMAKHKLNKRALVSATFFPAETEFLL